MANVSDLVVKVRVRLVGFGWAVLRAIASGFDAADVMFFAGLLIAGAGGLALSWRWTLVVIGAVLVLKAAGGLRALLWPPHPVDQVK